jgi:hypothetical protein
MLHAESNKKGRKIKNNKFILCLQLQQKKKKESFEKYAEKTEIKLLIKINS